jgi:hypothetical protein
MNDMPHDRTRAATTAPDVRLPAEIRDYAVLLRDTAETAREPVAAAHAAVIACLDVLAQVATDEPAPAKPAANPSPSTTGGSHGAVRTGRTARAA